MYGKNITEIEELFTPKIKQVPYSKIGAALLKHLQKFPDVLSTEPEPRSPGAHSLDIPQSEDL